MIKSTLGLLLALSLLFNVFFVVGFVRAQRLADAAQVESASLVGRELDLDQDQEQEFAELRATMHEQRRVAQEALALVHREIMTEMSKGDLDIDRLETLVDREMEIQREIRMAAIEHLRRFADRLTPEQRRMMLSRFAGSGGRHHRRFAEMLKRFDENGDGQLDPDEQAKARAFHEQRRRERGQRGAGPDRDNFGNRRDEGRRRFIDAFDEDGDGELNEQERAAREEWIRQRRRGGS
ncbi:MAG: periplasmic heavy metal sensor [Phycisphaerales bacterium]|nr:periplasmic heavy metal sensor [Phycisphaerae bacterium]NNM26761.1 periplasmic heavy metal sensor [Phycisphaerales bacterium]